MIPFFKALLDACCHGANRFQRCSFTDICTLRHIVCTMRTKTAWEVVETSNGKKAPQKIGLKPEQREGMECEFTLVLNLALEGHIATAPKDWTSLFDGRHFVPGSKTGKELAEWLNTGRDPKKISAERMRARESGLSAGVSCKNQTVKMSLKLDAVPVDGDVDG